MELTHEYLHSRRGYRFGVLCCWVRVYMGEAGDAPVVVCSEAPELWGGGLREMAEYLAAEVVAEHFDGVLPDLPRPLLWVEHHPPRRRAPERYSLLTFPSYSPRPAGIGFVRPITLGTPRREALSRGEVAILIGGAEIRPRMG